MVIFVVKILTDYFLVVYIINSYFFFYVGLQEKLDSVAVEMMTVDFEAVTGMYNWLNEIY